jgi:uncharacterized membrane protein
LKQKYSAVVGIVGGLVDVIAGLGLLQPTMMMGSETMVAPSNALWASFFLIALGVIVLLTGLYLLTPRMMKRSIIGPLMLLYGLVMLVLGFGMLGRGFSMMQNSTLSGAVMLLTGIAMLYSGYGMTNPFGSIRARPQDT